MHGSAPDIAGKGIVNPFAMLLTSALMLEELGHIAEAKALNAAIEGAVRDGKTTRDLGGDLSTTQATDEVISRLL